MISFSQEYYDDDNCYNLCDEFSRNFGGPYENNFPSDSDFYFGFNKEEKNIFQNNSIENEQKSTDLNTEKNSKDEVKTGSIENFEKKENKEETEYLIKGEIFSINKEPKMIIEEKEKEPKEKQFLGKKRLDENHTKNAFDNIVRKIKSKLFGAIIIILNKSLEEKNKVEKNDKRGKKGERKNECFLKPEQQIILQTNVKENLELLDMKLREIFSKKVSEKVKNYSKEHQLDYNKNFIEKIKDDPKKQKTNEILDMTFFQCLEHFRGSQKYEALNGLEIEYENVIEEMNDDIEYKDNFIENLRKYEILFRNKKPRKSKKKIVNKDDDYY
jgi:hypothetical protein